MSVQSPSDNSIGWDSQRLSDPHAQPDKADRVRCMFDDIAPRYDLMNRRMTGGRDRAWRQLTVRMAGVDSMDRVLDIACGTGDFVREALAQGAAEATGMDFSAGMLRHAQATTSSDRASFFLADAQSLPVANNSYDVVTCGFGIRNFQNLATGLSEMFRVLKPGGRAAILECSVPRFPLFRWGYKLHMMTVVPLIARITGGRDRTGAYRYLGSSVVSFVDETVVISTLKSVGFADVRVRRLMLGSVTIYIATKRR